MGIVDQALKYASLGWPVIPVHSCDGVYIGKEPYTEHGFKDASESMQLIRQWWRMWPDANIGIRTGFKSGVVVLDVDLKNNGPESLARLEAMHGKLPKTVTVKTGGGGSHYYFKHPGFVLGGRLGMRRGLDVKADGGGIVAPPSNHFSGKKYEWVHERGPFDCVPAEIPDWLMKIIVTRNTPAKKIEQEEIVSAEDRLKQFVVRDVYR